jgi:hypothetical protein
VKEILMNTLHKKPEPLYHPARRAPCPVCGHVSYSPAGIHPQCAMHAADQKQINRLKARKLAESKTAPAKLARYEKQCPKCRTIHHIRKQACNCGHSFQFKNGNLRDE